jgi:hypothetical protein
VESQTQTLPSTTLALPSAVREHHDLVHFPSDSASFPVILSRARCDDSSTVKRDEPAEIPSAA